MKNDFIKIGFMAALLTLLTYSSSCKRGVGELNHTLRYTATTNNFWVLGGSSDSFHTGYGDYITSITPKHFSAKLLMMYYMDNWDLNADDGHSVSYIDEAQRDAGIEQFADFSNNQEIDLTPVLHSKDLTGENASVFKQKEVTFIYFIFVPWYLYQELELPVQYKDVRLSQFDEFYKEWISPGYGGTKYNCDTMKFGTLLKSKHAPFISRLFDGDVLNTFVFGNTDSTFVFNRERNPLEPSKDWPFGGSGNRSMAIRSNKFTTAKVTMPDEGQTMNMISTILFNTEQLIQIYAGIDNIPYTSDDIMLYAPKFWERIKIKLETK